jgi:hypothetical protein
MAVSDPAPTRLSSGHADSPSARSWSSVAAHAGTRSTPKSVPTGASITTRLIGDGLPSGSSGFL